MGYNRENAAKVRQELDRRRREAIELARVHTLELHEKLPEIFKIDCELSKTGMLVMEEISRGGDDLEDRINDIRLDNAALREQREEILVSAGYPADYSDINYSCPLCSDTGFVGTGMCRCMKKMLTEEGFRSAGISKLIETQSFDSFSLSYYSDNDQAYRLMKKYLSICKNYAEEFDPNESENMLFCGNTGLGKTHLSTAIARVVVEKGYDVCYNSAQNILNDFEAERFGKAYGERDVASLDKYFSSDLLIIDDLGTESVNQFTVSCIYNIINTRVVSGKPIIISTNLTHDEMRKKYSDRIASRLFGEFNVMNFQGRDVRFLKL